MKLAHRPRIASTTIKLISQQILLSILSILLKTIQRISAEYPEHRPDKHARKGQGAAVWQRNLYYIMFSTYQYTLAYCYGELNNIYCDGLHILITFI